MESRDAHAKLSDASKFQTVTDQGAVVSLPLRFVAATSPLAPDHDLPASEAVRRERSVEQLHTQPEMTPPDFDWILNEIRRPQVVPRGRPWLSGVQREPQKESLPEA